MSSNAVALTFLDLRTLLCGFDTYYNDLTPTGSRFGLAVTEDPPVSNIGTEPCSRSSLVGKGCQSVLSLPSFWTPAETTSEAQ